MRLTRRVRRGDWFFVLTPVLGVIAAMVNGTFGSADSIVKATPLLFVGVGTCIAFRGSDQTCMRR